MPQDSKARILLAIRATVATESVPDLRRPLESSYHCITHGVRAAGKKKSAFLY